MFLRSHPLKAALGRRISTTLSAGVRVYSLVLLLSFAALPLRGLIAGSVIRGWGVWPVQVLDGVATGPQSVAVPGLIAHPLNGTGRVNVGQGAVMTVHGLAASLSPAIGGWLARLIGYKLAFFILGGFALRSLALSVRFAGRMHQAWAGIGGKCIANPA